MATSIPVTLPIFEDGGGTPGAVYGLITVAASPSGSLTGLPPSITVGPPGSVTGTFTWGGLPGDFTIEAGYGVFGTVITSYLLHLTVPPPPESAALAEGDALGAQALITVLVSAALTEADTMLGVGVGNARWSNCHPLREPTVCGLRAAEAMVCTAFGREASYRAGMTEEGGVYVAGFPPVVGVPLGIGDEPFLIGDEPYTVF